MTKWKPILQPGHVISTTTSRPDGYRCCTACSWAAGQKVYYPLAKFGAAGIELGCENLSAYRNRDNLAAWMLRKPDGKTLKCVPCSAVMGREVRFPREAFGSHWHIGCPHKAEYIRRRIDEKRAVIAEKHGPAYPESGNDQATRLFIRGMCKRDDGEFVGKPKRLEARA